MTWLVGAALGLGSLRRVNRCDARAMAVYRTYGHLDAVPFQLVKIWIEPGT